VYGSLFREWKAAALFVGGIAIVVAVFFSEGGGYEHLRLQRKQPEPEASAAPVPRRSTAVRYSPPVGFTPDEELEAAFAAPSEAVATPVPGDAAPAPAAVSTDSIGSAEPSGASLAPQQLP
jgi:hypothetical protein